MSQNTTTSFPNHRLNLQLEKQASRIALLEEELHATNNALEEKSKLATALEIDLEHAIYQV
jgi:hypothetical protein